MATDYYTLNIVSATYGQWDVTQAARDIYIRNANTTQNSWTLTPTNGMFGGDPIPMSVKVFVCLCLSVVDSSRHKRGVDGAALGPP